VNYNSLDTYVHGLETALWTPYKKYEEIGIKDENGEWKQLNTSILQIENEFYNPIRPKQTIHRGERATVALRKRGIQYVEVRALDINPLLPVGISLEEMRFLDVFLTFCVLEESSQFGPGESELMKQNLLSTVLHGRDSLLQVHDLVRHQPRLLTQWLGDIFENLVPLARELDADFGERGDGMFTKAVLLQLAKVRDNSLLPSAQVIAALEAHNESYFDFAMRISQEHERYFKSTPLKDSVYQDLTKIAKQSVEEQEELEKADRISFDDYVKRYFSHYAANL